MQVIETAHADMISLLCEYAHVAYDDISEYIFPTLVTTVGLWPEENLSHTSDSGMVSLQFRYTGAVCTDPTD